MPPTSARRRRRRLRLGYVITSPGWPACGVMAWSNPNGSPLTRTSSIGLAPIHQAYSLPRQIGSKSPIEKNENAQRLMKMIGGDPDSKGIKRYLTDQLLQRRPQALVEAVQILNAHRDEVVKVMTRSGYTDPQWIGGYLDRDLPTFETANAPR